LKSSESSGGVGNFLCNLSTISTTF
jgi:hypothetical protein